MGRFLDQAIVDYRLPIVSNELQTTNFRLQIVTNKLKLLLVPLLQRKQYRHSPYRQAGRPGGGGDWTYGQTDGGHRQAGGMTASRQKDREMYKKQFPLLKSKRPAPISEVY